MMSFRRLVFLTLFLASLFGGFLNAHPIFAQTNTDVAGLQAVSAVTNLPTTDPRIIAARIINVALGTLAIIFVVLIIYAGFLYMTSGGDAEKTTKAKTWIRNAIIGLIIILSAWAITTFVINKLIQATGGGGGGGTGSENGGSSLGGGGTSNAFQVQSITPVGTLSIRNVSVRFLFSREISQLLADANIHVYRASDHQPVAGKITVNGVLATFEPNAACPPPNTDRHCFDGDTDFSAEVAGSMRSIGGQTISCGGFSPECKAAFKTGNLVDVSAPTVSITSPLDGENVSVDDVIRITSHAADDSGVSFVETWADGKSVGKDGPLTTSTALEFDASANWDTTGLALGNHILQAAAHDIDSNQSTSP
ncbi:MAG TPA: Ig-like domain-containing protein, partial [Patescibacteria group bacterium]|nr:Ig-like domain-containing protein [Patescibacteria group bacterium]